MKIVLPLLLLCVQFTLIGQSAPSIRSFDSISCSTDEQFSPKIQLVDCPNDLQLPIHIALSYFPDLTCKKIVFKSAKIATTMNARPTIGSLLFSKKENRVYVVRLNNQKRDSVISIQTIPFNGKIGIFGHEFCHFADYQTKSIGGVMSRGFAYLSAKKKAKFEKQIDRNTINRGLGWQLYDFENYVFEDSNATSAYKKFKQEIYLEPSEIIELIKEYDLTH